MEATELREPFVPFKEGERGHDTESAKDALIQIAQILLPYSDEKGLYLSRETKETSPTLVNSVGLEELPQVILELVKDMELLKRENRRQALVLAEYERTVCHRFSYYGECCPPTLREVDGFLDGEQPNGSNPTVWFDSLIDRLENAIRKNPENNTRNFDDLMKMKGSIRYSDCQTVEKAAVNAQEANHRISVILERAASLVEADGERNSQALRDTFSGSLTDHENRFLDEIRSIVNPVSVVSGQSVDGKASNTDTMNRILLLWSNVKANSNANNDSAKAGESEVLSTSFQEEKQEAMEALSRMLVSRTKCGGKSRKGYADLLDEVSNSNSGGHEARSEEGTNVSSSSTLYHLIKMVQNQWETENALQQKRENKLNEKKRELDEIRAVLSEHAKHCAEEALDKRSTNNTSGSESGNDLSPPFTQLFPSLPEVFSIEELEAHLAAVRRKWAIAQKQYSNLLFQHRGLKIHVEGLSQIIGANAKWQEQCWGVLFGQVAPSLGLEDDFKLLQIPQSGESKKDLEGSKVSSERKVSSSLILAALRAVSQRVSEGKAITTHEGDGLAVKQYDATTFREALGAVLQRLVECGERLKRSLFVIGTDESASDDLLEELRGQSGRDSPENESAVERHLAVLLQKYSRWTTRLDDSLGDHLSAQRRVTTYLASVVNYFSSAEPKELSAPLQAIASALPKQSLTNLIDIDCIQLESLDALFPVINDPSTKGHAEQKRGNPSLPPLPPPSDVSEEHSAQAHLNSRDSGKGGGSIHTVPYDRNLSRLYESQIELHTILAEVFGEPYLSLPEKLSSWRHDDGEGFVDVSLDDVLISGSCLSSNTSVMDELTLKNNATLHRFLQNNAQHLHWQLKRFRTHYKELGTIIQRDTTELQRRLALTLKSWEKFEAEDRKLSCHTLLTELQATAGGSGECYFSTHVKTGDSSISLPVWISAMQLLQDGVQKFAPQVSTQQQKDEHHNTLVSLAEAGDVAALYVNWLEGVGKGHVSLPLPRTIRQDCVREDAGNPHSKISHFNSKATIGRVLMHMFHAVALSSTTSGDSASHDPLVEVPSSSSAIPPREPSHTTASVPSLTLQRLRDELSAVKQERDEAQSEAATLRAARQSSGQKSFSVKRSLTAPSKSSSSTVRQETLREVLQYLEGTLHPRGAGQALRPKRREDDEEAGDNSSPISRSNPEPLMKRPAASTTTPAATHRRSPMRFTSPSLSSARGAGAAAAEEVDRGGVRFDEEDREEEDEEEELRRRFREEYGMGMWSAQGGSGLRGRTPYSNPTSNTAAAGVGDGGLAGLGDTRSSRLRYALNHPPASSSTAAAAKTNRSSSSNSRGATGVGPTTTTHRSHGEDRPYTSAALGSTSPSRKYRLSQMEEEAEAEWWMRESDWEPSPRQGPYATRRQQVPSSRRPGGGQPGLYPVPGSPAAGRSSSSAAEAGRRRHQPPPSGPSYGKRYTSAGRAMTHRLEGRRIEDIF